jgi:hypothetical protein
MLETDHVRTSQGNGLLTPTLEWVKILLELRNNLWDWFIGDFIIGWLVYAV